VSTADVQVWVAIVGGFLAAILGILRYFNYRTRRDRVAAVGDSFTVTVEALASDNVTRRMAAAVLLRRFFDPRTEQGSAGAPYLRETIEVIAGMLREPQAVLLQKVLADGLRYAVDLRGADLQRCDLRDAYLGVKKGDRKRVVLAGADLFGANLAGASLRGADARGAVFYEANCERSVFIGADLEGCDFRDAVLTDAKFSGARIGGAKFAGAVDVPAEVAAVLGPDGVALSSSAIAERTA
jgi:uncharacterized protein YjbI with pentapeptide repeats